MELEVSPMNSIEYDLTYSDNSCERKYIACNNEHYPIIRISESEEQHEGKPNKHSSRKQSKRRKKSSNHTRPLPRIIVKPLPPPPTPENREWMAATSYTEMCSNTSRPSTMREVLASIPGFCLKPRKRSNKKLSTAAQLQQTKDGCIDLETPDSILVNTNIRALLNKHTFSLLPPLYQYKLGQLLPSVDRPSSSGRLSSSSLNNEFFARACLEWQASLSGGEFTPENQQKMKTEAEKEKSKIDPWKLKHFEPIWGEKPHKDKSSINLNVERPSLKTTIKLRPTASITSSSTVPKIKKSKSSSNSKRMRSVGAVTRSSTKTDDVIDEQSYVNSNSEVSAPDLLPQPQVNNHSRSYIECQVDFSFSDSLTVQRVDDSVSTTPVDSASTTPVDPLLLADAEIERNELKQDLHLSVVTIEETDVSKEVENRKAVEPVCSFPEGIKRLNPNNDEVQSIIKRIKYEDDYVLDDTKVLECSEEISEENNCSNTDAYINYANDQICPGEDIHSYSGQDPADTNSEDSKATASVYEYDDRSLSSVSSLKLESNVNNIVDESNENLENYTTENTVIQQEEIQDLTDLKGSPKDDKNEQINVKLTDHRLHEDLEEENNHKLEEQVNKPLDLKTEVSVQEISPQPQPTTLKDNMESPVLEKKEEADENFVHTYYDEHFNDAESFIMETGGISILKTQCEEVKYSPHPNLMELSSYISENNVTAVVTMPITQNSSIPIMEVSNSSMVSYPDDSMQDPAKPKNSAVSWKTESNWNGTENVITIENYSNSTSESAKYMNEDSKTSMEDANIIDENYVFKEERDTNFNMECSNSSESCNSLKEICIKQDIESIPSLASSTAITSVPVTTISLTQSIRTSGKKSKSGKESGRNRGTNKVPPGAVNLERSYQICQAVIQNSPNRDALRGQLRPPPALLSRPARPPRQAPPPPPPPVLVRHLPVSVMQHNEITENRSSNIGQYILVQRTPTVVPRAASAPPANQNSNVSVSRCRSVGAEEACVCNLRAMVLCKKCGAFCHDDCLGAADLCFTCLIR